MGKSYTRRVAVGLLATGGIATAALPLLGDGHGQQTAFVQRTGAGHDGTPAEVHFDSVPLHDTDFALGAVDAPVTLIKYGSLTCPHCAAFHVSTAAALKEEHIPQGRVRYIHRHFPLNQPAMAAAMLLHSGNPSIERFYALLDILYSEQRDWAGRRDYIGALRRIAARAGIGADEFTAILSDRALSERILAERDEGAQTYGVNSTPTLLINGGRYPGNRSIAQLEPIFEQFT